jgi:hypothetical protein
MDSQFTTVRIAGLLLGIAVWGGSPAMAQMQAPVRWLAYRNDTVTLPIRIQGGSVGPDLKFRFGPPHFIGPSRRAGVPGEIAWDQIVVPGLKTILITDPVNINRVYFRGQILFGNFDQFYSIQLAGVGPDKVPRVRMVLIPVPAMMALPRR